MRQRVVVTLLCLVVGVVAGAPAALAANGPGLNAGSEYEELVAQPVGYGDQGSITVTNVECNPGGVSSFEISASGTAYGPYPGTFDETATVTVGPSGQLQSYEASFTIHAGDSTVHGTKALYADDPDRYSWGSCSGTSAPEPGSCDSSQQLTASTKYEATVARPSGSFTDYGVATVEFDASQPACGSASVGNFIETFVHSSITLPVPGYVALRQSAGVTTEVGGEHTVTAYVATESEDQTVGEATVHFTVTGSQAASGVCTTDFYGLCDFAYQGPRFPGTDVITAYVDVNNNGVQDAGEPTTSVAHEWVLPASTPGQASGGGQTGGLTFDFSARSERSVLRGTCSVAAAKTTIKCLNVTAYVQSGNTVTIYGRATIDGQPTIYRITAIDQGEPGASRDVFQIETSSGFSSGGLLAAGNVRVF